MFSTDYPMANIDSPPRLASANCSLGPGSSWRSADAFQRHVPDWETSNGGPPNSEWAKSPGSDTESSSRRGTSQQATRTSSIRLPNPNTSNHQSNEALDPVGGVQVSITLSLVRGLFHKDRSIGDASPEACRGSAYIVTKLACFLPHRPAGSTGHTLWSSQTGTCWQMDGRQRLAVNYE